MPGTAIIQPSNLCRQHALPLAKQDGDAAFADASCECAGTLEPVEGRTADHHPRDAALFRGARLLLRGQGAAPLALPQRLPAQGRHPSHVSAALFPLSFARAVSAPKTQHTPELASLLCAMLEIFRARGERASVCGLTRKQRVRWLRQVQCDDGG